MLTQKSWEDFKKTGLLLFVNQFLHIFGWVLVFEVDDEENITNVYPARTKYRGFSEQDSDNAYVAISEYMEENSTELLEEALS